MQANVRKINKALEESGMNIVGLDGGGDGGVSQDEVVLPWEMGDMEERMRGVEEQRGMAG